MPIALRAWFGQDEVSHGSERYRVGVDRLLIVPATIAVYLINNAGFHAVSPAHAAPLDQRQQSLVRVRHPTALGCSYGGCEYRRDENGEFLVPAMAVTDLIGHGFVPVEAADPSRKTAPPISVSPTGEQVKGQRAGRSAAKDDELLGPRL